MAREYIIDLSQGKKSWLSLRMVDFQTKERLQFAITTWHF